VTYLTRRALLAISILLAFCATSMADILLAPAEQYFSVTFPSQPDQKSSENLGIKHTMYGSKQGDKVFSVAHALWPSQLNPLDAVQSMINGLVERLSAELLSIKKTSFNSASGKKLPATRFTFGSARLWGEALLVVSGQNSYMVQVLMLKPSEGLNTSDKRFFSSFKVLN
jgi:hypothetical protein